MNRRELIKSAVASLPLLSVAGAQEVAYLYGSGKPGLGVDINEQLAAKNPQGPSRDGGA